MSACWQELPWGLTCSSPFPLNHQFPGTRTRDWFLGHSKGPAQQQDLTLILVPGTVLCPEKSPKDIGQQKRLLLCCCLPSLAEFLTPWSTLCPLNENEYKPYRQFLLPQTQLLIPHREPGHLPLPWLSPEPMPVSSQPPTSLIQACVLDNRSKCMMQGLFGMVS